MRTLSVLGEVRGLLALDDLWTASLEPAAGLPPASGEPDFEGLRGLAAGMDALLTRVPEIASEVRTNLEAQEDEHVSEALGEVREEAFDVAGLLDQLLSEVAPRSIRDVFIWACQNVEEEAGTERDILYGKVQKLEDRELPDPDLRPLFRCALTLVGLGSIVSLAAAGAVATLGVAPTVLLGVAGGGYELSKVWEKSGCTTRVAGHV
jgi:hypothetical protein